MASEAQTEPRFRAVHRNCPVTPRKSRYVVDLIRGMPVNEALDVLHFCPRRAAAMLRKVVLSALANAQQDPAVDHNRLHIVDVRSDDGPTQKRWKTRSRGQMFPLLLRFSHLTVVLGERDAAEKRQRAGGADRSRKARVEASRKAQGKPVVIGDADAASSGKAEE